MNYAIFRSEPIMTTHDLAQIGSHNQREKKAYNSNPDIRIEDSYKNLELVPLNYKYVKRFKEITKEYEKQHNEKQKTERKERQRSYTQMLNQSRNCVADELLFTASPKFFENMSNDDLMNWANTCMEFVYNDLGYKKEQILHATIHLDEKSPHIHCVVVPLVKKLDKRTNTERWTISKKQFIKDKIHLSQLQDKYHERLTEKGFDLERGIKGSSREHLKTKELKKTTRYYENKVETINKNLEQAINDLNDKMKSSKNTIFGNEYIKVKNETFESMNNVIKETEKVLEFQPKIEQLFNEVKTFTKSHQILEKENKNMKVKYIKLPTDIMGCINCSRCSIDCNIKDEFQNIVAEIEDASHVLLGSPVYLDMPTAQMVAFLTRLNCKAENTDREFFKNKKAYLLATSYCSGTKTVIYSMMGACEMLGFTIEGRSSREYVQLWQDNKLRGGMSKNDSIYIKSLKKKPNTY